MAATTTGEGLSRWIARGIVVTAALFLAFGASGGPGWVPASDHAVLATRLQQLAAAPLYGLVAAVAACLPVGEVGFRLGVANALLGALVVAGVLRAARALLPKDPLAGIAGAAVLVLTPPFREAAATAGPAMLAAAGAVWAIAFTLEHARAPAGRSALAAIACAVVAAGAAPYLGLGLGLVVYVWLRTLPVAESTPRSTRKKAAAAQAKRARRRVDRIERVVILGVGAAGAIAIAWWWRALGGLPPVDPDATAALHATGYGAAAVVLGAGALGIAFGAATELPWARGVAAAIVVAAVHAAVVPTAGPVPLLALLAVAIAVIPSALARILPSTDRALIAIAAGLPLAGAALVAGAAFTVDDPGDTPARLASDMIGQVPAGPGVVVATRPVTWSAIAYAQAVAGARPDLELAPFALARPDELVVNAMRAGNVASSDVPAFGVLRPALAVPRRRGFQLLIERPSAAPRRAEGPPRYASLIGEREAVLVALARARYEATSGRLDNAARAVGADGARFGAADLAIMASTNPVHPSMYSYVPPLDGGPPGPWMLELFADDLAWVAGLELDRPGADAPAERRLHTLWRALLTQKLRRNDPALVGLGPVAGAATDAMLAALAQPVAE